MKLHQKSTVQKLIAKGKLEEAFDYLTMLQEKNKNESVKTELLMLVSRLNAGKKSFNMGLLESDRFIVEKNKIAYDLILLVNELSVNKRKGRKEKIVESYDVFLCFSSKDYLNAKLIWAKLINKGLKVFFSDETLKQKVGSSFLSYIELALQKSQNLLFYCTTNSLNSPWVKLEYETFFNEFHLHNSANRKLLILRVENLDPVQIPLLLRRNHTTTSIDEILEQFQVKRRGRYFPLKFGLGKVTSRLAVAKSSPVQKTDSKLETLDLTSKKKGKNNTEEQQESTTSRHFQKQHKNLQTSYFVFTWGLILLSYELVTINSSISTTLDYQFHLTIWGIGLGVLFFSIFIIRKNNTILNQIIFILFTAIFIMYTLYIIRNFFIGGM